MARQRDGLGPRRKGATTRASSLFAFAVLVMPPPPLSEQLVPRPPSSIEPKVAKQQVLFSHVHRRVRACVSIPSRSPTSCAAQLSDASAATALRLEPVAALNGAPSPERRVIVTFPEVERPLQADRRAPRWRVDDRMARVPRDRKVDDLSRAWRHPPSRSSDDER